MSSTLAAVLLTVAVALGIGGVLFVKIREASAALALWKPLGSTGLLFIPGQADAALLEADVHRAMRCIAKYAVATGWNLAGIDVPLEGWHLMVRDTPDFPDATGRMVHGSTEIDSSTCLIGSDRRALAHELEHALRWRLDKQVDTAIDAQGNHPGWAALGLVRAEKAFLDGEGA